MKISKEDLELIEKIKNYRTDQNQMDVINFKNEVLEKQNHELKNALKTLQSEHIDRNKLLNDIKKLKNENNNLKEKIEKSETKFDFLMTSPQSVRSVYGEIKNYLSKVEKKVLVCSPWITYLMEEFDGLPENINFKVITNFRKEDIEAGITDIDKIRVLKKFGADIRYNNNLHAKMVFIDSKIAIISSANMTGRGLRINYEAGVLIKDKKIVEDSIKFFKGVWKESKPLNPELITNYVSD
ncbi:phospholipase D-like domain-containing protein [Methanobacterium alcaliphilum]|uniref:phospholipase D-like domain-containing protein n=1 Tax=Methanobacterium alcaliphilum TaxID=392018 RepID=UPI00200B8661|nr:phospholipase D family protein [Methanobacterium alcaliphilum]MCK9151856.1 phospholipase D family protein [Methanobacterium alcaliphilum]